jgi:NitT/TauT family transport system permease protein
VGWPAALPYYVAAHEIAFTGSIAAAIVAEWFFSREGLGYLIVQSTVEYRADRLYAVMLIASLLAIGTYLLCRIWEGWLFRWKRERRT